MEVLQLLGSGLNTPQIAETLSILRDKVEAHRKHLKRKLEIGSYNKLVKYARAFERIQF